MEEAILTMITILYNTALFSSQRYVQDGERKEIVEVLSYSTKV
jgi:hypothetical protein